MDDSAPRPETYTEVTVRIPDDLARRLGTGGAVERRVLEALALDEFRQGHLSRPDLSRLLEFETCGALDDFLRAHETPGAGAPEQPAELDDASRARGRRAAANIIARRKGVTLGGLSIKDLINEGRP